MDADRLSPPALPAPLWELRFASLFDSGRSWGFPCDADGHVDLDSLSERGRSNYFYARTVIGRDVSIPAVHDCSGGRCTPVAPTLAIEPTPCLPARMHATTATSSPGPAAAC